MKQKGSDLTVFKFLNIATHKIQLVDFSMLYQIKR